MRIEAYRTQDKCLLSTLYGVFFMVLTVQYSTVQYSAMIVRTISVRILHSTLTYLPCMKESSRTIFYKASTELSRRLCIEEEKRGREERKRREEEKRGHSTTKKKNLYFEPLEAVNE